MGLHQFLCVYAMTVRLVFFAGLQTVGEGISLAILPLLGLFSFCQVVLFSHNIRSFALSYCPVILLSLLVSEEGIEG